MAPNQNDKNGNELAIGDKVTITATVAKIGKGTAPLELSLDGGGHVHVAGACVEKAQEVKPAE